MNGRLAVLYYQVGRLLDGAKLHQHVISTEPLIPGPYAFAATALSSAGRVQEADALLEEGSDRWPANPFIWSAPYRHLLFRGRPASAAPLVMDPEARPSGLDDAQARPFLTLARAVEQSRPADVEAATQFAISVAQADVTAIANAAPVLALLGRQELSFASLERYLLNRGSFGPPSPIGPLTRRYTDFLYSAPMASVRAHPKFGELTEAIGLDGYWESTGKLPDRRR